MVAMFSGMSLFSFASPAFSGAPLLGIVLFAPSALYLQRINSQLKSRREPLTQKQRNVLFGIQVGLTSLFIVGLFIAAVLRQTPLLWSIFGLVLIIGIASLASAHNDIYKDDTKG